MALCQASSLTDGFSRWSAYFSGTPLATSLATRFTTASVMVAGRPTVLFSAFCLLGFFRMGIGFSGSLLLRQRAGRDQGFAMVPSRWLYRHTRCPQAKATQQDFLLLPHVVIRLPHFRSE